MPLLLAGAPGGLAGGGAVGKSEPPGDRERGSRVGDDDLLAGRCVPDDQRELRSAVTSGSTALLVPSFALQGSYRSVDGASAQAVVMRFSDARSAARYFSGFERALLGCRVPDGPGGLAVRSFRAGGTSYDGMRRYEPDETWREHDRRRGLQVTILLVAS